MQYLGHVLQVPRSNGAVKGTGDDTWGIWMYLQSCKLNGSTTIPTIHSECQCSILPVTAFR